MSDTNTLLKLTGVSKEFPGATKVLENVDLQVEAGESIAIIGPSGSGKSTLLNLIGTLDQPTAGKIAYDNQDILSLNEKELAQFRNESIGFVFQFHHLLPQCTALENVLVPTIVNPQSNNARERATQLLERVGLADRINYHPAHLSGGERQRVAVVRALINKPKLLLADEPTGSLSSEGAAELGQLILELNKEEGMALIVVTHSLPFANTMQRVLELTDGKLHTYTGTTQS